MVFGIDIAPILTAFVTAIATALVAFFIQKKRFKDELELDKEKFRREFKFNLKEMRTEFMAEQVVLKLLDAEGWELRTFKKISSKLGGFEDDELRKILVRAGAVRFKRKSDGEELWGLLSNNMERLNQ